MDDIVKKTEEEGYVETAFGRRRYVPELKSSNYMVRQFGSRVAMNTYSRNSSRYHENCNEYTFRWTKRFGCKNNITSA